MEGVTDVIDYSTYMRAGAEVIVARKDGHGCVNDYERRLRDSVSEYDMSLVRFSVTCIEGDKS
jgi:hypothetical protein